MDGPDLDRVFAALSDPTRRSLLAELLDGDRSVGELAAGRPMSLAAVSKHLGVLARAGLIRQHRAGRERTCRLEPDGLDAAAIWMQSFGGFARGDYEALEQYLALEEDTTDFEALVDGERTDESRDG